jgi:tetratricopeptide (TPR) repeat protein
VTPAIDRQIAWRAHPALERAVEMRIQGRYGAARRAVERALEADPDNIDAWRERYEIALADGQHEEAAAHALRLVGWYVKAEEWRLAVRFTEEVLFEKRLDLPPRFYLAAGAQMERVGEAAVARLLYECLRNRRPGDPAVPTSLVREARGLERKGLEEEAIEKYGLAASHPACPAALRQRAREASARLRGGPASEGLTPPVESRLAVCS